MGHLWEGLKQGIRLEGLKHCWPEIPPLPGSKNGQKPLVIFCGEEFLKVFFKGGHYNIALYLIMSWPNQFCSSPSILCKNFRRWKKYESLDHFWISHAKPPPKKAHCINRLTLEPGILSSGLSQGRPLNRLTQCNLFLELVVAAFTLSLHNTVLFLHPRGK